MLYSESNNLRLMKSIAIMISDQRIARKYYCSRYLLLIIYGESV